MNFFPVPGEPLEPEALTLDRARQVCDALALYPFASLIEARRRVTESRYEELLVAEIDTELPQDTDYDIRSPERLAFSFERSDRGYPAVLALRTDFPHVSHLYWTRAGEPKSLCLYESPWAEVRLRWTGAGFLGDVARWLCRTAVGELHTDDQPLEPFLYGPPYSVVVPHDLLTGVADSALLARQLRCADNQAVAAVWQQNDDGSVSRVEVPLSESIRVDHGGWCFVLDHALVESVGTLRRERLPAETGGVLIGYFDVPHRRVYVVDALPAPDDSHERRDAFVRGCAGLPEAIRDIEARTSS